MKFDIFDYIKIEKISLASKYYMLKDKWNIRKIYVYSEGLLSSEYKEILPTGEILLI